MKILMTLLLLPFAVFPARAADLEVGDPVPDVALLDAGGLDLRTTDFRGQRELVLAWFPLAFTPG